MEEKKFILDRSDIMALSALLISAVALIVSIYEANIMKEQQEIMISQQKASVWPYVDGNITYNYGEQFKITYSLVNKGVGPAIIKDGVFTIKDTAFQDYEGSILSALQPFVPKSVLEQMNTSISLVSDKVLSPEEEFQILFLQGPRFENDYEVLKEIDFEYKACFCSIYDECWQLEEDENGKKLKCE